MDVLLLVFGFVLCIVLIATGASVASEFFKYKAKLRSMEERLNSSEKVQFEEELASMKHRLVVLEKIVTDKGYQVDEEIARLKSIK